jgi:hypothetical protein
MIASLLTLMSIVRLIQCIELYRLVVYVLFIPRSVHHLDLKVGGSPSTRAVHLCAGLVTRFNALSYEFIRGTIRSRSENPLAMWRGNYQPPPQDESEEYLNDALVP